MNVRVSPVLVAFLAFFLGPLCLLIYTFGKSLFQVVLFFEILQDANLLIYLIFCLGFLLLLFDRGRVKSPESNSNKSATSSQSTICFLLTTMIAFGAVAWHGRKLVELPPTFHDEYSYIFQAETFLNGHLSYPEPPLAKCFEQPHVVTNGTFASRYFPGTALVLMPFVLLGRPFLMNWICTALTAGCMSVVGCQHSLFVGYMTGILIATFPGMLVFGNSILSPTPTMLFFSLFLIFYMRMFVSGSRRNPLLAGLFIGITLLIRPLTAFGLGLHLPYMRFFAGVREEISRQLNFLCS